MSNSSSLLDEYIKRFEKQFPNFEYYNAQKDDFEEKKMLQDDFTIIIRGVSEDKVKAVISFTEDVIYEECIENDRPLPGVITLQKYSKKCNWDEEYTTKQFKELKDTFNFAAEDYTYLMAA